MIPYPFCRRGLIIEHVEGRLREHLLKELSPRFRPQNETSRLFHVALVFLGISNAGQDVNHNEVMLLKELSKYVNVVPIVSKADMLLPTEYERLKLQVRDTLKREGIYDFPPIVDLTDDEWVLREAQEVRSRFPLFTVSGHNVVAFASSAPSAQGNNQFASLGLLETGAASGSAGSPARLREYPWGTINLERDDWNDFHSLQKLVLRSFFEFLRVHTDRVLYSNYRGEQLQAVRVKRALASGQDPLQLLKTPTTAKTLSPSSKTQGNTLPTPTDSETSLQGGRDSASNAKPGLLIETSSPGRPDLPNGQSKDSLNDAVSPAEGADQKKGQKVKKGLSHKKSSEEGLTCAVVNVPSPSAVEYSQQQ